MDWAGAHYEVDFLNMKPARAPQTMFLEHASLSAKMPWHCYIQTIDEAMDGVLALLQRLAQRYYDLALLQNLPMRKLTVDLDVELSRDWPANRATKTNVCMPLREY